LRIKITVGSAGLVRSTNDDFGRARYYTSDCSDRTGKQAQQRTIRTIQETKTALADQTARPFAWPKARHLAWPHEKIRY